MKKNKFNDIIFLKTLTCQQTDYQYANFKKINKFKIEKPYRILLIEKDMEIVLNQLL